MNLNYTKGGTPPAKPQRRIPSPMRSTFQKSAARINGSTVGRPFQFALLLVVLSFGWNAIVPQALAAPAIVSIAASDAAATESGVAPTDTGTFTIGRPNSSTNA